MDLLLKLDFVDQYSAQQGLNLYQNIPNPFSHSTIIPFQTPEDMEITIRVINMDGRLMFENKKYFRKGYHEIEINKKQLDQNGMYYYQLMNGKNSLYRKMILMD
jgi:hypothetical protein